MNDENLITFADRPEDEQREISRKGGQASGEARRQRKTMRERLEYLMTTPNAQGIEHGEAIAETLVKCATEGNVKAAKLIGDYCGDFKQRIEVEDTTDPAKMMTREEATAIYWVGIERDQETLWNNFHEDREKKRIERTKLFDAACEMLGIPPGNVISDMMNFVSVEHGTASLVEDFEHDYEITPDYQKAIQDAAAMERAAVPGYLEDVVSEHRAANKVFERHGNKEHYYSCLVLYLCARSEQWRADHADQTAPQK